MLKLPNYLKSTENLNIYKHRLKEHFFDRINNEANSTYIYFNFFLLINHNDNNNNNNNNNTRGSEIPGWHPVGDSRV